MEVDYNTGKSVFSSMNTNIDDWPTIGKGSHLPQILFLGLVKEVILYTLKCCTSTHQGPVVFLYQVLLVCENHSVP